MPHPLLLQAWVQLRRLSNDTPGMIKAIATDVVPGGWIECDGRALDSSQYASLAAIIGPTAGNPFGDGSDPTTIDGGTAGKDFNIPDLRGRFIRGWNHGSVESENDPDAAGRTNPVAGQAAGDNIGSYQADAVESHSHSGAHGSFAISGNFEAGGPYFAEGSVFSDTGTTGNETRPANISLMYVIRI